MSFDEKIMPETPTLADVAGGEDDYARSASKAAAPSKLNIFHAVDYYLTEPDWRDKLAIKALAEIPNFLFAPFNNPIDGNQATPDQIADRLVYGKENEIIRAVRLREGDATAGIIRFESKPFERKVVEEGEGDGRSKTQPRLPTEISYFLHPKYHNRGLGTGAVLRALDWYIATRNLSQNRFAIIEATVDPNNLASYSILDKAGLQTKGLVASPYKDSFGENRPRLLMEGNVTRQVIPALQRAKDEGYYVPHAEASKLIEQGFLAVSEETTDAKPTTRRRPNRGAHRRRFGIDSAVETSPVGKIAMGSDLAGEYNCYRKPLRPNLPYLQNLYWGPRK